MGLTSKIGRAAAVTAVLLATHPTGDDRLSEKLQMPPVPGQEPEREVAQPTTEGGAEEGSLPAVDRERIQEQLLELEKEESPLQCVDYCPRPQRQAAPELFEQLEASNDGTS